MFVYLPATVHLLRDLSAAGSLGPPPLTGFALTPDLRAWYQEGDEEELEYAVFIAAAQASLRLLDADPAAVRRRVVVTADVPPSMLTFHPELDRGVVRLTAPMEMSWVVAVHVDGAEAEAAVREAARAVLDADLGDDEAQFSVDGAEDHELEWYAPQELDEIVALLVEGSEV
jgi:hypothetical protein